jgi:hypothetical protein
MTEKKSGDAPAGNSTDDRAEKMRERSSDLLAAAAMHVQRVEDIAEKLGLTADLVEGIGDELYEAVVSQLELASKIVERSQIVADRLLQRRPHEGAGDRLLKIEARAGDVARATYVLSNDSGRTAKVNVRIEGKALKGIAQGQSGRRRLEAGGETFVEITIETKCLDPEKVYVGSACAKLSPVDGSGRVEHRRRDFELWVRP